MTICGFKLGDDWSHLSFDNDAGINGGNTTMSYGYGLGNDIGYLLQSH